MTEQKPDIRISRNAESVYGGAARLLADAAKAAVAEHGTFSVALSGGSTPKKLYELLATPEWRTQIPWEKLEIFWGDERYVTATDASSNYRMTKEAMLSRVPVVESRVHRVLTEEPPDKAASLYENEIRRVVRAGAGGIPEFDLMLLGLGTNGHTASLFPHQPALHESRLLVMAEYIDEVKMTRITMTVPLINAARNVVFVVMGADKASVVQEVINATPDPERLPAQLIKPAQGNLIWLLDPAAAGNLRPASVT